MVTAPRMARGPRSPGNPFLKWAGGKRQLLSSLLAEAPDRIETYYEPFVGGGALFFALALEQRFRHAVIADWNQDLIDCYRAVQSDVDGVIALLRGFVVGPDEYYQMRALIPTELDLPMRAARTIYLNKVGFNGLYRVNSRGGFNVPYGRHKNPQICDEPRLRAASAALANVELVRGDFEKTVEPAGSKDFVYFDPPYVPVSDTSYFTAYADSPFGPQEQVRLANLLRQLRKRKVPALLSNSDCKMTQDLYKGLRPRKVEVRRNINSVATRRGPVSELLVKSFAY